MATHDINAQYSTFNNAGGNLIYNYNNYTVSTSQEVASPSSSSSPQPAFNDAPIDLLSVHFTGRTKELALITKAFERLRDDVPLRCVMFGDQGVGKSQLTYEWAKTTFSQRQNSYILWISATTVEKFDQGFSKLLHLVNHPDRSHPDQTVRLTSARRWLEEVDTGNWLLVLDNVFLDTLGFLRAHLPRKNGRGSILFTTRTKSLATALASAGGERHEVIEIPMLDVKDGVELFLGHFKGEEVDVPYLKVEEVVKSVGCLPLAISHTTAFMKQTGSTVDDMLALYQSGQKIDVISWENNLSDYEHKSVTATFSCQLDDLDQQYPDASDLLRVLAFFDTECIPLGMLITGANAIPEPQSSDGSGSVSPQKLSLVAKIKRKIPDKGKGKSRADVLNTTPIIHPKMTSLLALMKSPMKLRNAVTQLQNRSLIACQHTLQLSMLRMHDLIQLVVLENTKEAGSDQMWFEFAVLLACGAFGQIEEHGSPRYWPLCEPLVPHIQSLTARQEISGSSKVQLLLANQNLARYLNSRGRYGEAMKLYEQVLTDRQRLLSTEDMDTFTVIDDLALVYRSLGRYSDAEGLSKKVLQEKTKKLGMGHPSTLDTMSSLACVYRLQGRYEATEALFKEVLVGREKQLGSEHPDTLLTMYELATVYHFQDRYEDAETLLKQVLPVQEKKFGPQDFETLNTITVLGSVYRSQGRYDDAEALFKQSLAVQQKELGSEHPMTLYTAYNLARSYFLQRRYDNAEALFKQVLLGQEKKLGSEHLDTLFTMRHLAEIYKLRQCYDDAGLLFKKVLLCEEQQLGEEHVRTIATRFRLAMVYTSQGHYVDAEALLKQVLQSETKLLGSKHVGTLTTKHSLAEVYMLMPEHRYVEAEALLVQVLAGREEVLGLSHPHTRDTMTALALVYEKLRRPDDAERMTKLNATQSR